MIRRAQPRFVTFDCYGTLVRFRMAETVEALVADRVAPEDLPALVEDYSAFRADEVLGAYQPYPQVLSTAWTRTCQQWRVRARPADAEAIVAAVRSWGPHPEVPGALRTIAERYPLVILSNAADAMLAGNLEQLGVDVHRVITSEQLGAYKPRLAAFTGMLDRLDAAPHEIVHVSSHVWYDLVPAHRLGIRDTVHVDRGYDPMTPFSACPVVTDLSGVPALLGL